MPKVDFPVTVIGVKMICDVCGEGTMIYKSLNTSHIQASTPYLHECSTCGSSQHYGISYPTVEHRIVQTPESKESLEFKLSKDSNGPTVETVAVITKLSYGVTEVVAVLKSSTDFQLQQHLEADLFTKARVYIEGILSANPDLSSANFGMELVKVEEL